MSFYRRYWYYVGGVIFVGLAFWMALFGETIEPLRRILIVSFMALLIHEFEEYALPGGFPMLMNMGMLGEREVPERYPANENSVFVANVLCAYPLYILAFIFSDWYLLGLVTIYFSLMQFLVHGIIFNIKMKSLYNPGLATVVFVMYPVGIYYLWYLSQNYAVPGWYWWGALLILSVVAAMALALPIWLMKDKASPYPFSEDAIRRFSVREKVAKLDAAAK